MIALLEKEKVKKLANNGFSQLDRFSLKSTLDRYEYIIRKIE